MGHQDNASLSNQAWADVGVGHSPMSWAGLWRLALLQHFWAGRDSRGLECGPRAWIGWGESQAELGEDSQDSWWPSDAESTEL